MNFFSIRTNDQKTIGQILDAKKEIVFDTLSWHKSEISVNDLVFIVISGDSAKKDFSYENGLRAIGKVAHLPKDEKDGKHFTLKVDIEEFLPKSITKDDFYVYPDLKDAPNVGPDTRSAPNQAFRKIEPAVGKAILKALSDILGESFEKAKFTSILNNNFDINKLVSGSATINSDSRINSKLILQSFIEWFQKPENYKKSYEGLVSADVISFWNTTFFNNALLEIDKNNITESITRIEKIINAKENVAWRKYSEATSNGAPEAILGKNNYQKFLTEFFLNNKNVQLLAVEYLSNAEIKKFLEKFKDVKFQSIKEKYPDIFKTVYVSETEWMTDIENKLNFITDETDRNTVKNVIEKLKDPDYKFTEEDVNKLAIFSRVIDKTIKASNFINNFTIEKLKKDGLTIYDFFNKIKSSPSLAQLQNLISLSGTLKPILPFYYSAVKNCQFPGQYPIHYKYWYVLLDKVLNKGSDYDSLTAFYRTFPPENRTKNFFAFFGTLGIAILYAIRNEINTDIINETFYNKLARIITLTKYIKTVFKVGNEPPNGIPLEIEEFIKGALNANFFIGNNLPVRFVASLLTKPFVILTGLSGSGKTKLAQLFVKWMCVDDSQYCIVPVGADWTNREPLLGYCDGLSPERYIVPENGVLSLIINAKEDKNKPYFIILDEMNLSHVERYFADFLSVMESQDDRGILLHSSKELTGSNKLNIPGNLQLPKNLFIIGTVNIDETTYMFSPKVLDRANVIEFRVSEKDMESYLQSTEKFNPEILSGEGSEMAQDFVNIANAETQFVDSEKYMGILINFFRKLEDVSAEFGYRTASEIIRFIWAVKKISPDWEDNDIIDAAIMQKLLPKVHGSRRRLSPVLEALGKLCIKGELPEKTKIEDYLNPENKKNPPVEIEYDLSFKKISRMYKNLLHNGFTSYAEA